MSRLLIVLVTAGLAAAQDTPPTTHQIKLGAHTFTLPVGFTVERVAGPPLVDRPIVASFDDRGRLYVADSSGSNEKVAEQLKNPTHRIVRLEDTDGDGQFDKSTVFADKMMFPEGILWHRGHVYVAAPPHIWRLTDTDDDGTADKRDIWFDGKTLTGCANDLHGPYLGPDGWLYWAKGAFAKQEYTLPTGKKFTTRASHIFRARPDGTGIEPVMTGGMDNPVDVAFLPNGERFFTTTFFQYPAAGRRDGLIHAVYGGIYGKDHDVIRDPDHKWTSPNLMPVLAHMGPAAPCGLHCYEAAGFGREYTGNLFACQFNLRKVSRHVLKASGASYTTEDSDFLVSDNTDFHPTDVIEDADGSLLVVDTGGWYKLCCPSSQLVKADVLGAIYRVRRTDAEPVEDPHGATIRWNDRTAEALAGLLTDPRSVVRERATEMLASKGEAAIADLAAMATNCPPPHGRRNAVWALTRIDHPKARAAVRVVLREANEEVRTAAAHSASVWRDREAVGALIQSLADGSPHVRRAAAEALGRIGDKAAVPSLLAALDGKDVDRALEHALTYALIEIGDPAAIAAGLNHGNDRVRRATIIALDQIGKLELDHLTPLLAKADEVGLWIAGRHPEWAAAYKQTVERLLARAAAEGEAEAARRIAGLAGNEVVQAVLADTVLGKPAGEVLALNPVEIRTALLAMSGANLKAPPPSWFSAIQVLLGRRSQAPELVPLTLSTLRSLVPPKTLPKQLPATLVAIAGDPGLTAEVRLAALATIPGGPGGVEADTFSVLLDAIHKDRPAAERALAAESLSRAKLSPPQLIALIERLPTVGPLDIDRVLTAFAQTKDDGIGKRLLTTLEHPELRPALRADQVKERIKHFGPAVQAEAEKLYTALNADHAMQQSRLDATLRNLQSGDIRRGQAVFNSTKASCIACHTIGYVGGKQGPDLTRIGGIRTERDLLEAILFPSASFVRSYEPLTVNTKDGRTFNGVPKKDAPDEIILVLAADKEVRIPREDVEEVRPGKVSIMPAGLDQQLSPQELADLIAFLKACR